MSIALFGANNFFPLSGVINLQGSYCVVDLKKYMCFLIHYVWRTVKLKLSFPMASNLVNKYSAVEFFPKNINCTAVLILINLF